MNVKKATFTEGERAEIVEEFSKSHTNHVYKRLMVLKLKAIEGMRSEEVAKISGLCHTSVNKIVSRYKAEGIEAIFGKQVLEFLEREAAALDYTRIILETGTVNEKAVRFYLSNGYRVCENYGKYVGRADSVCFSKDL